MVTKGLDNIAPIFVFSRTIPNEDVDASSDHIHQFWPLACGSDNANGTFTADVDKGTLLGDFARKIPLIALEVDFACTDRWRLVELLNE